MFNIKPGPLCNSVAAKFSAAGKVVSCCNVYLYFRSLFCGAFSLSISIQRLSSFSPDVPRKNSFNSSTPCLLPRQQVPWQQVSWIFSGSLSLLPTSLFFLGHFVFSSAPLFFLPSWSSSSPPPQPVCAPISHMLNASFTGSVCAVTTCLLSWRAPTIRSVCLAQCIVQHLFNHCGFLFLQLHFRRLFQKCLLSSVQAQLCVCALEDRAFPTFRTSECYTALCVEMFHVVRA